MKPIVDGLIVDYAGKVRFYYIDVENASNAELLAAYRISAVPTFAFVNKDGTLNDYFVGGMSKEELVSKIEALK